MGSSYSSDESRHNLTLNVNGVTTIQSELQPTMTDDSAAETPASEHSGVIQIANTSQMNATNTTTTEILNNSTGQNGGEDFSITLFGYVLYPVRWITSTTLTSWLGLLSSLAMIIGCVLPYVPQYRTIYKTKNCSGFSTFVCLDLLLANILRIAFWFGHPFELPLLIQSIIMILAQVFLLEICVRVKRQNNTNNNTFVKKTLLSFNPRWFWRWTDLASYLEFLFIITTILGVTIYYFHDCELFIEIVGYCALVIESMLGLPQVIKNYKNRSVHGMSLSMVLMWLAGDNFKTAYYIAKSVPYQFWLCGLLQIAIDLIILCQVCIFRHSAVMKKATKHEIQESPKEMMSLSQTNA